MPTVSVIIPVYNAEKDIRRCVDSVLNQEYRDLELILVDDGSQDSTPAILDDIAAADDRVRVIHKPNGGVSETRNQALDLAAGKYVQFLDADDWIPTDSTKLLVRTMEEKNCDLVVGDFYRVVGENVARKGSILNEAVMSRLDYAEYMMESPSDYYYGVLWNKLYRRDIIEEYHLRMNRELHWCEDFIFNLDYLMHVNTVAALQVPVYYYVKTEGSLVAQSMKFSNIVKMKTSIYQYYDRFYRNVLSEEEYRRVRPEIASFLVAAASDDAVIPLMPGTKKLGEEGVPVYFSTEKRDNIITTAYYLNKAFDKLLNAAAMKHDLDLRDVKVYVSIREAGMVKTQKEISDFTGIPQVLVLSSMQKLSSRDLIETHIDPAGRSMSACMKVNETNELSDDIDTALQDLGRICLDQLSEQEVLQLISLYGRINQNLKEYLKQNG